MHGESDKGPEEVVHEAMSHPPGRRHSRGDRGADTRHGRLLHDA